MGIFVNPSYVVTGGRDCMVNILDRNNYEVLSKIDILLVCPDAKFAQPRSVCLNIDNKRVLVGTKGSEIYEFSC